LGRPALYLRRQIHDDRNRGYADDERCRVCGLSTPASREMSPPVPRKIGHRMIYNYSPFTTTGVQQIELPQNTSPCDLRVIIERK
jgi:hypothetical protein